MKKKRANFFKFCAVVGGLYLLHAGEQRILWCSSIAPQSIWNLKSIFGFVQNDNPGVDYFTILYFWVACTMYYSSCVLKFEHATSKKFNTLWKRWKVQCTMEKTKGYNKKENTDYSLPREKRSQLLKVKNLDAPA